MSQRDLTKIASRLLVDVKDLCDWGIDEGHIDAENMKLTVTGLRIAGTKLIESGVSKIAAARTLGVPESTFRDAIDPDSASKKAKRNAKARALRGETRAVRADEIPTEEEADESWQDDLYDQACLLLERMADETRQRFFAKMRKIYGHGQDQDQKSNSHFGVEGLRNGSNA